MFFFNSSPRNLEHKKIVKKFFNWREANKENTSSGILVLGGILREGEFREYWENYFFEKKKTRKNYHGSFCLSSWQGCIIRLVNFDTLYVRKMSSPKKEKYKPHMTSLSPLNSVTSYEDVIYLRRRHVSYTGAQWW